MKPCEPPELEDDLFRLVQELLLREAGIKIGDTKRTHARLRLERCLRDSQHDDLRAYVLDLARRDPASLQVQAFLEAFTINTTEFFRNPDHFRILAGLLPQLEQQGEEQGERELRVWSAACSTGEEPYSLAMLLHRYFRTRPRWRVRILATDINTRVLRQASQGSYPVSCLSTIPTRYQRAYLECDEQRVVVKPVIRQMVVFRKMNLLKTPLHHRRPVDIIFCRNVFIYFDDDGKQTVVDRMWRCLRPGGYLFLGHAESLLLERARFDPVAPSVHLRR